MKIALGFLAASLALLGSISNLYAASYANGVVAYSSGIGSTLTTADVALGKPGLGVPGYSSPGEPFYSPAAPLSPFASHFGGDQLVQIAPGGSLTLRLENFVTVGTGLELGIFGNTALIKSLTDTADGQFGNDEVVIEVSETGLAGEWVSLNGGARVAIDTPSNFFDDANGLVGPSADVADLLPLVSGLTEADFGKPFDNPNGVADFNGLTIGQIETLLDGSAGGDWFDLDGLAVGGQPLTQVGYVRFSDPNDPGLFGTANLFELMAVSINSSLTGGSVPVPEPTAMTLLLGLVCLICGLARPARCESS